MTYETAVVGVLDPSIALAFLCACETFPAQSVIADLRRIDIARANQRRDMAVRGGDGNPGCTCQCRDPGASAIGDHSLKKHQIAFWRS
jgi:hypothetical protein